MSYRSMPLKLMSVTILFLLLPGCSAPSSAPFPHFWVVTASSHNTARVWDAATGKTPAVLRGHTGPVLTTRFSPDGKLIVTASNDKTARVCDAATGKTIAELSGHTKEVNDAAFSPDAKQQRYGVLLSAQRFGQEEM